MVNARYSRFILVWDLEFDLEYKPLHPIGVSLLLIVWYFHCYKGCPHPLFILVEMAKRQFLILDEFINNILFLIQNVLSIII
jgi:hypothetical protein